MNDFFEIVCTLQFNSHSFETNSNKIFVLFFFDLEEIFETAVRVPFFKVEILKNQFWIFG